MADDVQEIQNVSYALDELALHQRAWFWLCPQRDAGHARLVITSMESDPNMLKLQRQVGGVRPPENGQIFMGMLGVDHQGRLNLAAPNLSEESLMAVADWTRRHHERFPGLARLRGLTMRDTQPDGTVRALYDSPAAWADVPERPAPGSVPYGARQLADMEEEGAAWFWLTGNGPGGQPAMVITDCATDPNGEQFQARTRWLRSPGDVDTVSGIATVRWDGRRHLNLNIDDLERATALVQRTLRGQPGLDELHIVQLRDGKPIRVQPITLQPHSPDLRIQNQVLADLDEAHPVWFWFTDRDREHRPLLLLNPDRNALKAAAMERTGERSGIRGRMVLTSKGYIDIQLRTMSKPLLTQLAAWASAHVSRWPALRRLAGSRITVRDKQGKMVDRYKNDDAWSSLKEG
ncbi:MAG: hypothetical protein AAFV53_00175 [Myxococcota bacterium]